MQTEKWLENFKTEIKSVEVMFDTLLLPGKLEDYYELKEQDGVLSLTLSSVHILPNPVADALYDAFVSSSPEKNN